MKKTLFTIVLASLCAILSSCTEENITPQTAGGTNTETVKF